VTGIEADGVDYETTAGGPDGVTTHRVPSKNVIWGAGIAGSPLGQAIARGTGAALDRAGRVIVRLDLSVPLNPEIVVGGDLTQACHFSARFPISSAAKPHGCSMSV
jgi:NADH dehydrogenase